MGTYERKVDLPTSASPRRRIVTSGASVAIMIESGQTWLREERMFIWHHAFSVGAVNYYNLLR